MRFFFIAFSLALTLSMALPDPASAFVSRKGDRVNSVAHRIFEVVPKGGSGDGFRYWCAAGDYARRQLGAPWAATVYIYRGLGPSETTTRRSAVQFTLDSTQVSGGGSTASINSLETGDSMSVQQAFRQCNELPIGF